MKQQLKEERSIRKEIFQGTLKKYDDFNQIVKDMNLKQSDNEVPVAQIRESHEMASLMKGFKQLNQVMHRLDSSH